MATQQKQYEVLVILPLFYSTTSERNISQADTAQSIKREIFTVTGGGSAWVQEGTEMWEDGKEYNDTSLRVVTTTRDPQDVNTIRTIAINAIDPLHQRGGVFFQVHEVVTEWLSREDYNTNLDTFVKEYLTEDVA